MSDEAAFSATQTPVGWVLNGSVTLVPGGAAAWVFWVPARCDSDLALFRVPARDATITPYRLVDGQGSAKLRVNAVVCLPKARFNYTETAFEYGKASTVFGALTEANGIIEAIFQATLDHVKLREQFGRPIGRFQVVQHRMAEMFIHKEEVHSMTQLAADAVQLHRGMGMNDEMKIGHLVKRLLVLIQTGGTRAARLARFQAL